MTKHIIKNFLILVLSLSIIQTWEILYLKNNAYAQNPQHTNIAQSIPNNKTITENQSQQNKRQDSLNNNYEKSPNNNQLNSREDPLKDIKDYQDKLINTVLLTLLGTVLAIAGTFFGYQVFANVISREQDKKAIQDNLAHLLEQKIVRLEQNLVTKTEQLLNSQEIKLKWLEYQIAALSAEQLDMQKSSQPLQFILKEHLRAIHSLQNLINDNQGRTVGDCLVHELEAIENFCETLNQNDINSNPRLREEIGELQNILNQLPRGYEQLIARINNFLNRLVLT